MGSLGFIGCDPDVHQPAFAVVDDAGAVVDAFTVPQKKLTNRAAVVATCHALRKELWREGRSDLSFECGAVESQEVYAKGEHRTRNPDDLLLVATISGAALCALSLYCDNLLLPTPKGWKGSVPKHIHQGRILGSRLGWKYEVRGSEPKRGKKDTRYCIPTEPPKHLNLLATEWKHAVDAIGLALFAREQHLKALRLAR